MRIDLCERDRNKAGIGREDAQRAEHLVEPRTPINVPAGITKTVEEPLPRSLCERLYGDIRQWREPGKGGDSMALKQPELLARDLRDFFRPLRS